MQSKLNRDPVIGLLNRIMELELAGVVRYTHYALMVYGYNRIPIVDWCTATTVSPSSTGCKRMPTKV
jgi:bacterioferritin (cytochrome b1)